MAEWTAQARIGALKRNETDDSVTGSRDLTAGRDLHWQAVMLAVLSGWRPIPDGVWKIAGLVPAIRQGQARIPLRTDVAGVLNDIEQPGMIPKRISSRELA